METIQSTNPNQAHTPMSIKHCIIETWKLFAFQQKAFFKYLWFHFLLAGIGFALFIAESTHFYNEHIFPTITYINSGQDASLSKALFSPSVTQNLILLLSFVTFIVSFSLMNGAIFTQLRFYKATKNIPITGPFSFWGEVKKDGKKSLLFDLILLFTMSICTSLIVLLSWVTSWWTMLLILPVFIYWTIIGINGKILYIIEKKPLKKAIRLAFPLGHHKFGGYLIMFILTSIPLYVICYITFQPIAVFQLSYIANATSVIAGEPSGIPTYVMPLYILISTLGFFIFGIGFALQQWAFALFSTGNSESISSKN